jgi:arylamine N-acetyltransferase
MKRLGLDPALLHQHQEKGFDLLCQLTEAHVKNIPFENLAQHGGKGGTATLDLPKLADKVLDRNRGGFCFELNGLFSAFLTEIGYQVTLVPAIVHSPDLEIGFDRPATHLLLMVKVKDPTATQNQQHDDPYLVDVAFGEPALHPLQYNEWNVEQKTSEGMISRLFRKDQDDNVIVEWHKNGKWEPRLLIKHSDTLCLEEDGAPDNENIRTRTFEDFTNSLELVKDPDSIFSRKLIVCRITRDEKRTLAGNVLKVTGPPRFGMNGAPPPVVIRKLESLEDVRHVLQNEFAISLDETEGLNLAKSLGADPTVWSTL